MRLEKVEILVTPNPPMATFRRPALAVWKDKRVRICTELCGMDRSVHTRQKTFSFRNSSSISQFCWNQIVLLR